MSVVQTLVLGDVHGCYYTLKELVKEHWQPEREKLVSVGDLINKGPHSGRCVKYWQKLQDRHPGQVILIRGNHEQAFIDQFEEGGKPGKTQQQLLASLTKAGLDPKQVHRWLKRQSLSWQNEHLMISHAGISKKAKDPFNLKDPHSVINNRRLIDRLDKVQVVGHTVIKDSKPLFSVKENTWYLDTGAALGRHLSALRFRDTKAPEVIRVATKSKDLIN